MESLRNRTWYIRLMNWEYWPVWVFYIPVWVQHFWLSLKVRNLFFFLATNPAIEGFILSDSKFKTLQLVPERHRPESLLVTPGIPVAELMEKMQARGMVFPVMLKPDVGFRGLKVQKVEDEITLQKALSGQGCTYLLQEYCAHPLEIGLFYYRYPDAACGCIPSITIKEFLKVKGDGKHTLEELIGFNPRAVLQRDRLKDKYTGLWTKVLPDGLLLELEPVGNHNRGTRFRDGSHLADEKLLKVFDRLNREMEGFYFGRFDIRASSWEAIQEDGAFTILEVNGVGGEPTHIYDPDNSLFKAWKDLCFSWRVAAGIAAENMKREGNRPTYGRARALWRNYKTSKTGLLPG